MKNLIEEQGREFAKWARIESPKTPNLESWQIILCQRFLASSNQAVRSKTLMDVALALGAYFPISGADLDDLPKLAKEMVEGIKKTERETVIAGVVRMVEGMRKDRLTYYKENGRYFDENVVDGWNYALDDIRAELMKEV